MFGRYVCLCDEVFAGLVQDNHSAHSAAVDLVNHLLPSLLRLHRDVVANVRITLVRCLVRHFVRLGELSFGITSIFSSLFVCVCQKLFIL